MVLIADLAKGPYWKHMNMSVETGPDGKIQVVMEVTEELLQVYGNVHGGAIFGLMDSCIAVAVNQELGSEKGAPTVEMKINYLRPVNKGRMTGRGRVIKRGQSIVVGQGEIFDSEDRIVAFGTGTFMVIDF